VSDESWRRKTYYTPRVLITTDDVLDCPFPDTLLCLTGAELQLLRNMTQYLHRRSTFASEYHDGYYLAPSNEEWNVLDRIVAELEDKLMGCEELTQLLQDIKAATECACQKLTELPQESWPSGGKLDGQRDYDDYLSPVVYGQGAPPETFPTWDDWKDYKCKAAQVIVDDINALGEKLEVLYTGGAAITFAVFQTLVVGTAITPPVALVVAILGVLVISATALAMIAFQQWCQTHKQGLVCAIHTAETLPIARYNVLQYIDANWDLILGQPFGEHLFSNAVISKAFDGGLDVSDYSADYCLVCAPTGERTDEWNFQGPDWESEDWVLSGGAFWGLVGYGCRQPSYLGVSKAAAQATAILPVPGENSYTVDLTAYGYGALGDESEMIIWGGPDVGGPWTPVAALWRPNFPTNDCGIRTAQRTAVDLTGYTHVRYTLTGIGVASPSQWLYLQIEWTLPE